MKQNYLGTYGVLKDIGSIIYMGVEKEIKKLYFKLSKLQNLNKLGNIVFLLHFVWFNSNYIRFL